MTLAEAEKTLMKYRRFSCDPHCLDYMCPVMNGSQFYTRTFVESRIKSYEKQYHEAIRTFISYHAGPGYYGH